MRAAGNAEMNTDSCKTDQHPQGKNQLLSRDIIHWQFFMDMNLYYCQFSTTVELLSSLGQMIH